MAKSAAERKRSEKLRRLAEGKKLYKKWIIVEHFESMNAHLKFLESRKKLSEVSE